MALCYLSLCEIDRVTIEKKEEGPRRHRVVSVLTFVLVDGLIEWRVIFEKPSGAWTITIIQRREQEVIEMILWLARVTSIALESCRAISGVARVEISRCTHDNDVLSLGAEGISNYGEFERLIKN